MKQIEVFSYPEHVRFEHMLHLSTQILEFKFLNFSRNLTGQNCFTRLHRFS